MRVVGEQRGGGGSREDVDGSGRRETGDQWCGQHHVAEERGLDDEAWHPAARSAGGTTFTSWLPARDDRSPLALLARMTASPLEEPPETLTAESRPSRLASSASFHPSVSRGASVSA